MTLDKTVYKKISGDIEYIREVKATINYQKEHIEEIAREIKRLKNHLAEYKEVLDKNLEIRYQCYKEI